MSFLTLPDGPCTLTNLMVYADGAWTKRDLSLGEGAGPAIDMKGATALPAFVDMHTHLDKGHIWPRASNPDGSFMGALNAVRADHSSWRADDLRARIDFGLRCAYAHGTRAIRTHLDSIPPQPDISWPVFDEIRADWAGRIDLQAVCLIGCDGFSEDGDFAHTADLVAQYGGVLGMVTYPVPDLKERLLGFFRMATAHDLAADFHVDETIDPTSETLRMIAETVLETGFDAPVTVGHCCSLSTQSPDRALDTLDLVAKAGINVVSLPMCNLYLQDRGPGTPRNRGVTLVHEMRDRDIPVAFASDNTRDPFYAYGDLDMLEVTRQATRIAHLDHSRDDWMDSFAKTPAQSCGFEAAKPDDLVIFKAREWTELLSRPHSDRIVLRSGRQIDTTLPDYAELDHLWEMT